VEKNTDDPFVLVKSWKRGENVGVLGALPCKKGGKELTIEK